MSITWKGSWSAVDQYAINDAVEYQGSSYIAVAQQPSAGTPPPNAPNDWNILAAQGAPGPIVSWQGEWSSSIQYNQNDAVGFSGSSYLAISPSPPTGAGNDPPLKPGDWQLLAEKGSVGPQGLIWRGEWSDTSDYTVNDGVSFKKTSYIAIQASTNVEPTDPTYWNELVDIENDARAIANTVIASIDAVGTIATAIIATAEFVVLKKDVLAAQVTADSAVAAAEVAQGAADIANEAAVRAQTTANQANDAAVRAQTTANQANEAAVRAQTTANQANAAAEVAQATANEANEAAQGIAEGIQEMLEVLQGRIEVLEDYLANHA